MMGILPLASFIVCSSTLRRMGRWRGGHVQTLTLVQSGAQLAACSQTGVDCLFQIFWTEADHGRVQGLCISAKLKTCPQPLACRLGLGFCALLVSKHLGEDQLRHRVRKRSDKRDLFAQARIWTALHRNGVSELGFLTDSLSRNLKEKTTTQPFRVNLQISRDVGLKMFWKSEL